VVMAPMSRLIGIITSIPDILMKPAMPSLQLAWSLIWLGC